MKKATISRDQLTGIWAPLPVPWQRDGALDQQIYARDIAQCCSSQINGVYSGGTTGEFYIQDYDLFCEVNEVLIGTAHEHDTPVQAGCTALGTAEVRKRVRFARSLGADLIQIALPFWLELDDEEVVEFFIAVADAAGEVPLVHYDTPRAKRRISPLLYQRLCRAVPTLWGTKFGGADIFAVKQITLANPELKVFVGEHLLASATPMGATGSYCALALLNPGWMVEYFEACRDLRWTRAFEVQDEACRLLAMLGTLPTSGLQDSAFDRLFGRVDEFMQCPLQCQPPYRSGSEEDLECLRQWMKNNLSHLLQQTGFA